jgi:hypothetical protein
MFVFNNKPIYCYHYNKLVPVQTTGTSTIFWFFYNRTVAYKLPSTGPSACATPYEIREEGDMPVSLTSEN